MGDCMRLSEKHTAVCGHRLALLRSGLGHECSRRGDWVGFVCPFCGDLRGKFAVNIGTLAYKCFICNKKGSATRLMRGNWGTAERAVVEEDATEAPLVIPGYVRWFDYPDGDVRRRAVEYFAKRRINDLESFEWGISDYSVHRGSFIIFPVVSMGLLQSYQMRSLYDGGAKTLSASSKSGWRKTSDCLYNYDSVSPLSAVVVTEGPAKAVRTGGVCLFGSSISSSQVRLLVEKSPTEVVIWLDRDAAKKAVGMSETLLRAGLPVSVVRWQDCPDQLANDPNDVDDDMLREMYERRYRVESRIDLVSLLVESCT